MYSLLLGEIEKELDPISNTKQALQRVCDLIHSEMSAYDWVGFYFMHHGSRKLHLGPYVGAPTDHTIIDFGKGICGQVAESGNSFLVDDVNAQSNYIACSIDVKSEIVVPLYQNGNLIAQIDIDSHQLKRFQAEDEKFLKAVNDLLARKYPELENFIDQLV
ncbi:GAF domain-containing protein [Croceimicrobium sp.]|uniref:GAF domain-containing protein n=1 Tax=Croceimicrobium sp. TaxID=2828340 RepID=UPI003BAA3912